MNSASDAGGDQRISGAAAHSPVVELRVHGVGGSSPEAILGVASVDQTRLVGGGIGTGFYARRDDESVEGYVWGELTSGSKFQPLWLVLLPFTLVNVAGWMHPPISGTGRGSARARLLKAFVHLLALSLTASWVIWVAVIAATWEEGLALGRLQLLGRRLSWLPSGTGGRWLSVIMTLGGVVALFAVAGISQRKYERVLGPDEPQSRARGLYLRDEGLDDPTFFGDARYAVELLVLHGLVASAAFVTCAWLMVTVHQISDLAANLGKAFVLIGGLQFLALGAIALCSIGPTDGFRFLPAAVTATIAVALSNGFFAGTDYAVARAAGYTLSGRPELALIDMFVVTLAAIAGGMVIWILCVGLVWPKRALTDKIASNGGAPGSPLDGLTDASHRRAVGRARATASGLRHLDLVLTVAALSFLVGGAVLGIHRSALLGVGHGGALSVTAPTKGWLVTVAARLLPWLALAGIATARLAVTRTGTRRTVGILWDVLTFWPRRFHPIAVRPYTERVVPELQWHVADLRHRGPVVVSAHSQGAVIACAVLAGSDLDGPSPVSLLTYGSPLGGIYRQAFPAYFNPELFSLLLAKLSRWRNYTRGTDAIGHAIKDPDIDVVIDDPGVTAASGDAINDAVPGEHDRDPWVKLARHSYYRNEPTVKEWVANERRRLADGSAGRP